MAGNPPREPGTDRAWLAREEAQAQAYDAMGPRYDEAFPHKEGQIEAVERLLTELPAGAAVLDVGCGTGLPTALQLDTAGCRVTGIDISPVMLESARRNVGTARFHQVDVLDVLTLPADSGAAPDPESGEPRFDAVVAFFSLLNLPKAQIRQALGLLHRALVPGGRLAYAMVEADVDDAQITFLGSRIRVSGYPRYELRTVLAEAGFASDWEHVLSYAPATAQAAPEVQIFGLCRRVG
ncbi:MAG TPA: class I SAM-dependent methyltransferase [Actinocrinis sp.]|nr:class I SAM-dependent methyltransferase [Actinocrinis sp.]